MAATQTGFELVSMTFQQDTGVSRFEYDQETTPPSMAVVVALSEAMAVDPSELEPLHTTVDTDALDTLARVRDTTNGDVNITFSHEGRRITVHSYGVVVVAPLGHEQTDGHPKNIPHK
jgi:hypothetical protein